MTMAKKTQKTKNSSIEKLSVRVGNKLLTLENADQVDFQFKKELIEVSKTNPSSIQEFFERLVELQRQNSKKPKERILKDNKSNRANKL